MRGRVKGGMTRPRRVEMMVVKGKAAIQTPITINLEYISRGPNKTKQHIRVIRAREYPETRRLALLP